MAVTTPPTISPLPNPPDPNNRSTFNSLAYPWSVAQQTLATQINSVATNVAANATDAANSAVLAATQAVNSANSATTAVGAANSAGATVWVNGNTYAQGAVVYSIVDYATYRKKTASSVTTIDPASDGTNWANISTPSQVNNSGKYLYTNGITQSWANPGIVGSIVFMPPAQTANTVTASNGKTLLKAGVQVTKATAVAAGWDTTSMENMGAATPVRNTTPTQFTKVVGGNNIFIATTGSTAYRSTDGVTWTVLSGSFPGSAGGLWFCNGLFITSSGTSNLATSSDGITWTAATHPYIGGTILSITFANGKYVAKIVSYGIYYSSDLTTWTASSYIGSMNNAAPIYYNGKFIGAYSGLAYAFHPTQNYAPRKIASASLAPYRVAYAGGKFIALSNSTTGWTSTDGVTWVANSTSLAAASYAQLSYSAGGNAPSIAYNGTTYVAAGNSGPISSPDGVTWTNRAYATAGLTAVVYVGSKFFAFSGYCSSPGSGVAGFNYSTDGITWTNTSGTSNVIVAVAYGGSMYVALGYDGANYNIYSSTDGVAWTARVNVATNYFASVCYGAGLFVAVGNNIIYTSTDGITWTSRGSPTSGPRYCVNYLNGKFYAVGNSSGGAPVIYTSTDGITWGTVSAIGTQTSISFVGYYVMIDSNNHLFTFGSGGYCFSIDNGVTWYAADSSTTGTGLTNVAAITDGTSTLIAAEDSNFYKAHASYDSIVWAPVALGISNSYINTGFRDGLVLNGKSIILGTTSGALYQSQFPMGLTTAITNAPTYAVASNGTSVVGSNSTAISYTSTDLLNWNPAGAAGSIATSIAYTNSIFCGVGTTNVSMTSSDWKSGMIGLYTAPTVTNATPYVLVN